ncbi:MAG: Sec-independent protein translocase protein TatB [Gammaproteobacteria bacterium]
MFDVGFWEVSVIFIIALLVIGPERLPRVARDVGLWVGKIRRYVAHVRSDIEREINAQEIRDMLEKPKELDDLYDVVEETKGTLNDAKKTLKEAQREADSWTGSLDEPADASAVGTEPAPPEAGATPTQTKPEGASVQPAAHGPSQSTDADADADAEVVHESNPQRESAS